MLILAVVAVALLLLAVVDLASKIGPGIYCHDCGRLARLWTARTGFGSRCMRCVLAGRRERWRLR